MKFFIKTFCFFTIIFLFSCTKKGKDGSSLFSLLNVEQSGIDFKNTITESDSMNIIDYEYIYNGGGVALADFDNDGLEDVVFTGNMVESKIYKNKSKLQFEDITQGSGFSTKGRWCTGIAVADVNQDGKKDIYVTASTHKNPEDRKNMLFINQTENGKISFKESASEYGIADTSYTTNATFFDYDNDGDLDLFIINNKMDKNDFARYTNKEVLNSPKVDKLFQNNWDSLKGHPFFTDVSQSAGIVEAGYSLGFNVFDINKDGYKDIYVTNDFLSNDVLYINNKNGTFSNKINEYFNHTSFSAMGIDVADFNNDALQDVLTVDMLPEDNYRKKTMMGSNNYTNYINNNSFNYTFQFVRNVLQYNNGVSPERGHPLFGDIAMLSGIEATDWSWAPLLADFDGDGFRDIIITNGFPKDITDKDFMDYQSEYTAYYDKKEILSKIPIVKLKNYAYRNTGDLKFENVTEDWGIELPSFSNGAAYGDLDNDGDLDYIVNNIDDVAHVYENHLSEQSKSNYLKIDLKGVKPNLEATGTIINYSTANISSTYEHTTSRGYLSVVSSTVYLGLGKDSLVNLEVIWPDHQVTKLQNVKSNQTLVLDRSKVEVAPYDFAKKEMSPIFTQNLTIPQDTFSEQDYIDFNSDPLLLKKLSNLGPGVAVGDVNKDGNDDFYITGSRDRKGTLYISSGTGFKKSTAMPVDVAKEELAPLFIDIDGDADLDLYIGCGSNEYNNDDPKLKDVLLINNNGIFQDASDKLPVPNMQTACVKACDYDGDGDMDLFIGGKAITYKFPMAEESFLLTNESTPGNIKFTKDNKPFEASKMMISDALWSDYDNDGSVDLITVGDFDGISFYKNTNGKLVYTPNKDLNDLKGWWNSINGADFDNDGDIDYVVGNYGENSILKASSDRPIRVYSKDFDENGSYDFIPTTFLKDQKGVYQEVPYHVKGDLVKELNGLRKKFIYYSSLAKAPIDSIVTKEFRKDAYVVEANYLLSVVLINMGNGKFEIKPLPTAAQFSSVLGSQIQDFDDDGQLDVLLVGNNYGTELTIGKLDASFGTLLKGDGKGYFSVVPMDQSGLDLKCEPRSLAAIQKGNKLSYIMTNYDGPIKGFNALSQHTIVKVSENDLKIQFKDASNKILLTSELYNGNGYLSQSSKYISYPKQATTADIWNSKKEKRTITLDVKNPL